MLSIISSHIDVVPIIAIKTPVFPSVKEPASLSSIFETRKPSHIAAVPVYATRAPVEIVKRAPIEKCKSPFKPVTTTFLPSAKVPASLSSISVTRKPPPVTTDYIHPRPNIFVPEYRNIIFDGAYILKKLENMLCIRLAIPIFQ